MKKIIPFVLASLMAITTFFGCSKANTSQSGDKENENPVTPETPVVDDNEAKDEEQDEELAWLNTLDDSVKSNLSASGYVEGKIGDFTRYEGTTAYRTVSTADEFIQAIVDAKYHYTNTWDETTSTYTQTPADGYTEDNFEGSVHVIEITCDLNLGYSVLSDTAKASGVVDNFTKKEDSLRPYLYFSSMFDKNGMSQIKVENTSNLLIYSKNGAKITHAGFKLTSDTNVVFRNLQLDELWQWDDAVVSTSSKIGDYDWFSWAYFKISFCGYVWIDHCTFGKSYDGLIDYSNPVYADNAEVAFRAPYGADGGNGLHISWCSFNSGSDDENGYIYKMMSEIEENYQSNLADSSVACTALYYKALRDSGISFEDILYGIAIPQKKGFLCGDTGDGTTEYQYNLQLRISFANCTFKNIEDRIPKLRGGNAYMYNCIVDSTQYYGYRTKLRAASAASEVASVNSTWKCALVSQCILCSNEGSIQAECCIFRGIENLLKNNDSTNKVSGYRLVDCLYQKTSDDDENIASSDDGTTVFTNASPTLLTTASFAWRTDDGKQPFYINSFTVMELADYLGNTSYGAGAKSGSKLNFIKTNYVG